MCFHEMHTEIFPDLINDMELVTSVSRGDVTRRRRRSAKTASDGTSKRATPNAVNMRDTID